MKNLQNFHQNDCKHKMLGHVGLINYLTLDELPEIVCIYIILYKAYIIGL